MKVVAKSEETGVLRELKSRGITAETVKEYLFATNERGALLLVEAVRLGAPISVDDPPPLGFFMLKERIDDEKAVTVTEILVSQERWDELPKDRVVLEVKDKSGIPIGLRLAKNGVITWDDLIERPDLALIADDKGWSVAHEVARIYPVSLEKAKRVPVSVFKVHTDSGWAVVHEAIIKEGSLIDDLDVLNTIEPIYGKSAFTLGIENNQAFFNYVQQNLSKFSDVVCFFDRESHSLVKLKDLIAGNKGIKLLLR